MLPSPPHCACALDRQNRMAVVLAGLLVSVTETAAQEVMEGAVAEVETVEDLAVAVVEVGLLPHASKTRQPVH